mmetsp:Transcript_16174/g.43378  ORF Transcript_16174/g.43378 Transcript_16174/m.43378 type:complete len:258 (-) Transcript_16174:123-896(-)
MATANSPSAGPSLNDSGVFVSRPSTLSRARSTEGSRATSVAGMDSSPNETLMRQPGWATCAAVRTRRSCPLRTTKPVPRAGRLRTPTGVTTQTLGDTFSMTWRTKPRSRTWFALGSAAAMLAGADGMFDRARLAAPKKSVAIRKSMKPRRNGDSPGAAAYKYRTPPLNNVQSSDTRTICGMPAGGAFATAVSPGGGAGGRTDVGVRVDRSAHATGRAKTARRRRVQAAGGRRIGEEGASAAVRPQGKSEMKQGCIRE